MTPPDLLTLLSDFYRETLELAQTRQAHARAVEAYDANNAYQQVIGRQDVHLRWISDAIADLSGTAPDAPGAPGDLPSASVAPGASVASIVEADARYQRAFLDRWTPRAASVTNARHRKMLSLILGEMSEHFLLLQHAMEGRLDVMGRASSGKVMRGSVIAARPRN